MAGYKYPAQIDPTFFGCCGEVISLCI